MNQPIDLTNLRSMTDGDKEMEKALFEEFFSSFEQGIKVLSESLGEKHAEIWRKQSHALKGIAVNLGAEKLGAYCKQGQEEYQNTDDKKIALLMAIENEYEVVKKFLLQDIAI